MEHLKHITPFGLPPSDLVRIQDTWGILKTQGATFPTQFYDLVLDKAPELQPFFPSHQRTQQQAKFFHGLEMMFELLDRPHQLRTCLLQLGKHHAEYGIGIEHYPPVIDSLLALISDILGERLSAQAYRAWIHFLCLVRAIMLEHLHDKDMNRRKSLRHTRFPSSGTLKRILLLDDSETLLHLYQAYLEIQGYVCSPVSDIDWVLTHLQLSRYDVIVTDFHMPRMNGVQVKKWIHEAVPTCPPWILLTGDLREDVRQQAREAGFLKTFDKPQHLQDLRALIEDALRNPVLTH